MDYIELTQLNKKGKIKRTFIVPAALAGRWGVVVLLHSGERVVLTKKLNPDEEKTFRRLETVMIDLEKIGLDSATIVLNRGKNKSLDTVSSI